LFRIGFAAAKQLVNDGASIMISSRKKTNVEIALEQLQKEYGVNKVKGQVCHVSKKEDRNNLIQEVFINYISGSQPMGRNPLVGYEQCGTGLRTLIKCLCH